jgi:hypothetical protein
MRAYGTFADGTRPEVQEHYLCLRKEKKAIDLPWHSGRNFGY